MGVQSLAIVALCIWFFSYHSKSRTKILCIQLISCLFWIVHFILLEAYTGALLTSISTIRLFLFLFKTDTNWISSRVVMWIFFVLLSISTYVTGESYWSIAAFIGGCFALIASWQSDINKIRKLFIPSHIGWLVYNISVGSIGGIIAELFLGISAAGSLFSGKIFSFLKKKNKYF